MVMEEVRSLKRNDDDAGDLSVFDKHPQGKMPQRPGTSRWMQQRR
jgi:hypothetical protein